MLPVEACEVESRTIHDHTEVGGRTTTRLLSWRRLVAWVTRRDLG